MKNFTLSLKRTYLTLVFLFITICGFSQIAQRGTATTATSGTSSITINKPTGIVVGDIMIVDIAQGTNGTSISASPTLAGWTLINGMIINGSTKRHGAALYKIAVAADLIATNYTFTLDTLTDSSSGAIIAFSGVDSTTPFDVAPGTIFGSNSTTVNATTLTSVTPNSAIVMLGMSAGINVSWTGWTTTSPGVLTELFDVAHNAGRKSSVGGAWQTMGVAGSTGTGIATISSSERNGAILLALRPLPSGPPVISSLGSTSGCPGTSITINGTNLSGATASGVTIGGTAVSSITSNSGSVLVAIIGSGTTGTVSVTTGSGSATSASTFTVNTPPTITSTTPGSRTGTGTVTLGATASAGTISWFAALTGGAALGTGTSFVTPSISSTTTYYVETNNGTCTSTPRVAVVATVNQPEIDIQGNAVSIVNNDATPSLTDWTIFGSTTVGSSLTRTFTIFNTGTTPLTIGAITFSGGSIFTLTTPPSATVAAGSSTTFVVTFTPTGLGAINSTITIANDDTNENPYKYDIQGTGVGATPEIDVLGNSTSITTGDSSPTTVDFTDFAGTSIGVAITRTFTITNTGLGNLTLGAITFSGGSVFSLTTSPSATVLPGASTTFVVTFNPSGLGVQTDVITIANNDSNESPYTFTIQGTGFSVITNGPGGVMSNLQLWLRSDLINGTTGVADNTAVSTWNTQARGANAVKPAAVGSPIYKNNPTANINFNSVVDFTNNYNTAPLVYTDLDATRQYLKGTSGFYSQDIYVVMIPDVTMTSSVASNDIFCGDRNSGVQEPDATGLGYAAYTNRLNSEVLTYAVGTSSGVGSGYGVANTGNSVSYSTAGIINARNNSTVTGSELTFNENNVINSTSDAPAFVNVSNSKFWIGRSEGWDGSLDGRVAEIITLNARATNVEKNKIQSYLAIKYGITLAVNGTSVNYTNSDGNTIWDSSANAGFNFDIAGIGRDDISKLNQKQSKSINPTEVMTIGLTDILPTNTDNTNTFVTNKSYLVWGANGGTMLNSGVNLNIDLGPTTITTVTEVVNRKWKVVETGGDVGTTRVSIPTAAFISGLPALGPTDAYVMVIATNAAFTTGVETVFTSTIGTDQTVLYDFDGIKFITFGVAHQAVNPLHITLDGFDDYVRIGDANELGSTFSIMAWIRPNGNNTLSDERTIIAKKPTATTGYRLVLQSDNKIRMEWYGKVLGVDVLQSAISNTVIPDTKWHNVAVTYGANALTIYIDGVLDKTTILPVVPFASTSTFSIGGQYVNKLSILNLFKGDIDEVRMWNRVVTQTEIRYAMNQEILQDALGTKGTILPTSITKNDISALTWNSLFAYYSMNSYIGTHLDDDSININRGSLVIPDKISISLQTAPMPYNSFVNGNWSVNATWLNGVIQDVPYSLSIVDGTTPIAWNILKTNHNIDSNGNKVILGLYTQTNTLTASNDSKIEVSHYLKVDGKIDLSGMSQLVQTLNSDLDPTSAGSIERDQQGQSNIYNYNYWSSPVGAINNTTNNNAYTVSGVMKDGTTSTPQNITWTPGLNGSATSPITLSSYWIFKFQNLTPAYANWQSVGPSGSLNPGQGYTLKGSGGAGATQNLTFVGKPNNGPITSAIAANNLNLSGNPYASSIDATQFISDNGASTTGTLYFWQHSPTNLTHNTAGYQGGYATRNSTGGVAPVAPVGIAGEGTSAKVPGRYIPVGQGFFVIGSSAGGNIVFNNNQRLFIKETDAASNTLFKSTVSNSILSVNHFSDNSNDDKTDDEFKKIRLAFKSTDNFYKQALLGFMENNATDNLDYGYDAINIDSQVNDMYFINSGTNLNIQGVGYFNVNNIYPLGVKNNVAGDVIFRIEETQNFDFDFEAFIYDNVTNIYHNIRNTDFTIALPQGTINNRFSLRFINQNALGTENFNLSNGIQIVYTNSNSILTIKNNVADTTIESVTLFNMIGQAVATWDVKDQSQQNILLPIKNLSSGTYIAKVKTDKGDTSRKIVFN